MQHLFSVGGKKKVCSHLLLFLNLCRNKCVVAFPLKLFTRAVCHSGAQRCIHAGEAAPEGGGTLGLHPVVSTHTHCKRTPRQLNLCWLRAFTENRAAIERDKGNDVKPADNHLQWNAFSMSLIYTVVNIIHNTCYFKLLFFFVNSRPLQVCAWPTHFKCSLILCLAPRLLRGSL